ncbi:MAG: hypothetical protein ABIF01_03630, partial [Candidatus Micrarchaeota archaeon]
MRFWTIAPFAVMLALVLSGCPTNVPTSDLPNAQTFTLNATGTNASIGRPNCTIMTCRSDAGWLNGWFFNIFGTYLIRPEMTLYRGSCGFVNSTPLQIEDMLDTILAGGAGTMLISGSDLAPGNDVNFIRHFMYGQGPTFAEFDEANAYCSNNMSIVIKWFRWDPENPTLSPYANKGVAVWEASIQRSRATCYLKANVIPVYIFYTNSTLSAMNVNDIQRFTSNFKEGVNELGPIVICPEFGYNSTKLGAVGRQRLVDMIRAIRQECSKCMIMLAPQEGDIAGLSAILDNPVYGAEMNSTVNIIGQSWTLNKDEQCSFYTSLNKTMNFSRSALSRYQKPTLWAYLAAANTTNALGTCEWREEDIADAFDMVYINTPGLVAAGGIGLGHFQLLDGNDIIHECSGTDCDLGLMTRGEGQKQPMFNRWFKRCLGYHSVELGTGGEVKTILKTPIVFNTYGDSGSECNIIPNLGPYRMIRATTDPEPTGPDMVKPTEAYNCDMCFGNLNNLVTTGTYPNTLPSNWYITSTIFFDDLKLAMNWNPFTATVDCDQYRISIRKHAELDCNWDMDPLFLRAMVDYDSEYQTCTMRYTPITDTSCNPTNIMTISDPSGACSFSNADRRYNAITEQCETNTGQPGWAGWTLCKPCTYGVMRCEKVPYNSFAYAGTDPDGCGPEFNPFDPQMGMCCGQKAFCNSIRAAINWAYGNVFVRDQLLLLPDGPGPNNRWAAEPRNRWTILFLALLVYEHQGDASILQTIFDEWQQTKWCANSVSIPNPILQGQPQGPIKTFIWNYCNAYNETGAVFSGPNPDPWARCIAATEPDWDCHIACCADTTTIPGWGYWFDPVND